MGETSTLMQTPTRSPNIRNKCVDINGKLHSHGDYFTPAGSPCSQCPCNNGHPGVCIMLRCEKPKCRKYKEVSGKCCDFKCVGEYDFTDKATLAIVISLSIVLVFTVIAIILVVCKMIRKKQFGERLSSVSLNSQHQPLEETDIDDIIQKNSIPNNLRQHLPAQTLSSCSYARPKLNNQIAGNFESNNGFTITTNDLQKYPSELSCNSICEDDIEYSSQSDDGTNSLKVRCFEPPVSSYTPLTPATFI